MISIVTSVFYNMTVSMKRGPNACLGVSSFGAIPGRVLDRIPELGVVFRLVVQAWESETE